MTGFMNNINTLICPSDPSPTTFVQIGGGFYGVHNYNMCTGSNYSANQVPTGTLAGILPNGLFFENSSVSFAAITDGTSSTVAVADTIRSTAGSPSGANSLLFFQANPLSGFVILADNKTVGPPITSDADYQSMCLTSSPAGFQAHVWCSLARWCAGALAVQHPSCSQRQGLRLSRRPAPKQHVRPELELSLAERHRAANIPAGANALLCDGHVQFIKNTISVPVWQSLGSRNGGEIVGSDAF